MTDSPDKILVVDDEPSIRALYQMAFAHSGYDVQVASTGEDAWECLTEEPVKLVFLDLNLPGIKGLELCRNIKKSWPECRLVAISGNIKQYGKEACMDAGFSAVLPKPIQLADLLNAARTALT